VKPLLDQNLSRRLVSTLSDIYPGASHVALEGLERAPDAAVCAYARDNGFVPVTKDSDFVDLALLQEAKVIWLRLGNCTTSDVEQLLRASKDTIEAFMADPDDRVLELF
jgi:predicted nuclease of predicted toxin-antitoxin system